QRPRIDHRSGSSSSSICDSQSDDAEHGSDGPRPVCRPVDTFRSEQLRLCMTAPSVIRSLHLADSSAAPMQIAGLSKRYGEQRALIEISFDVRAREVLGLIGPNGAGKTTLLETIAGIVPADAGDVLWHGTPLSHAH